MSDAGNFAFVFIKPHAADSEAVVETVESRLREAGLTILRDGAVDGPEIDAQGIVDRHYSSIAEAAFSVTPDRLTPPEEARAAFRDAFGCDWENADVRNAAQAREALGCTGRELGERWGKRDGVKLAPGLYAAPMTIDGTEAIVLNGFYLQLREKFTATDARVVWYDTVFDPADLSWKAFRQSVIGATNPSDAESGSMRHHFYTAYRKYGLPRRPTMQDNCIHASAGPLEAAKERIVWLDRTLGQDPFVDRLRQAGLPDPDIEWLLENPSIRYQGSAEPAFDRLEDRDSEEAVDLILRFTGRN